MDYSEKDYPYFRNRIRDAHAGQDIQKTDLMTVANIAEGEAVLKCILQRLGTIDYVHADAASIALHNEGMHLLQDLCEAAPTVACRIVCDQLGVLALPLQ